jgi:hypothetical protein
MKALLTSLLTAANLIAIQGHAQQPQAERMSDELSQLVYSGHELRDPVQLTQWRNELRTKPGITNELWRHLWLIAEGKEEGGLEAMCYALAQRSDMTKAQETSLIDKLDQLTQSDLPKRASSDFELILGLLFVLERGADPRSEQIAIKLMNSQNPDASFCLPGVLRTMKQVGGDASLEAISAYVKRKFGPKPEKVFEYREFAEAETAIKARQATKTSAQITPPVQQPTSATPKQIASRSTSSSPSEEPTSSTPWSIIVVLIVAATGLLWLLVKNRK